MNRLLAYYQKELGFLKEHGKMFTRRFPKIARRLGISEGETEDPHVSRLIESFALLTSRLHQRLDDDIPEVIDALLSTLAPQFLRPLPSACIVMMTPDLQKSGLTGSNILNQGMMLFTRLNMPLPCQFQTVYPVILLPLSLNSASLCFDSDDLSWQLQLVFRVWPGAVLANDKIRLYLHGPDNAVSTIYSLLCSEISRLTLHQAAKSYSLNSSAISPVGFNSEDAMLSRDPRIAPVHFLLLDYFWFPQKFSFIDIDLPPDFTAAGNETLRLQVVFKRNALTEKLEKLSHIVDENFFRLHCTPAVNLFSHRAEPITLNDGMPEYPVMSDSRHQSHRDVWAIDQVSVQRKIDNQIVPFYVPPLLENRFAIDTEEDSGLRWQFFHRETSSSRDIEETPFIAFSESPNRQTPTSPEIATISMLCTNHLLPYQMQYGHADGDFDLDAPFAGLKVTALTHPTRPLSPVSKSEVRWRILSLLSLNHQLLCGGHGVQQLKESLALYNIEGNEQKTRLFNLIKDLTCEAVTARLISNDPHSLARGINITVTFGHEALRDPQYYLHCSLLDRLLALYAPVNSFIRLTTCIEDEIGTQRVWPIRAGKLSWL